MKFYNGFSAIQFPWEDVASVLFRRYPNPHSKHVLTEDVVERYIKDGKLHTKKLLTKTNHMPRWGERFYSGPRYVCVLEESVVDPDAKVFTTYTRNISLGKFLSVTEKCVYSIEDTKATKIQKSVWLESNIGYGLSLPVLEFAIKRYKTNQHKATLGIEHILTNSPSKSLVEIVRESKEKLTETAKQSKEKLTETAKQSKELCHRKQRKPPKLPSQKQRMPKQKLTESHKSTGC